LDTLKQQPQPEIKALSIWTTVVSLALWLALCIGAAVMLVAMNIRDAEQGLTQYGDTYADHLNKELVSSETVLKGFSALFGAVGNTDPEIVARYVWQVIESNPQIFALEIVQRVPNSELVEFVAGKRRDGFRNFTVKSFSYESDRKWQPLEEKPFYYPIVFMEPMPPGSEDILGLDVDSVSFLRRAMRESLLRQAPVASHPFRLVEGNLAYVVFCPIPESFRRDDPSMLRTTRDELVVNMVIDATKLVEPVQLPVFAGGTVLVHHKDFGTDDPGGQLLALSGEPRGPVETALFPTFVYKKSLATMGEPFVLLVKRQVGWSDLSLGLLALMAMLTILSSVMLVVYLRAHRVGRLLQIENARRLWQLANHDSLTGLPNRMLLMDRMEQLLARMRRQEKRMAVMFLDLDDFKKINDAYGHEVGDRLLKFVAESLRAVVRMDDTVARLSGDEFIILIEGVESLEAPAAVREKIQKTLSQGFLMGDHLLSAQASIGVAMFPEDGDTPEDLIKQADMRMYAEKPARTGHLDPT